MNVVTDTMGLVLFLENRKRTAISSQIFQSATAGTTTIYIPAITLAEVAYLSEKKRIDCTLNDVEKLIHNFPNFIECPFSFNVILRAFSIGDIPELHDRLIAGTAAALNLPLLTNDPVIAASKHCTTNW